MVTRVLPNGLVYHEPPFTTEEQIEFYRKFGGSPRAILRGARRAPNRRKETAETKSQRCTGHGLGGDSQSYPN